MAWFLFIDESGQDRKEAPYEVLAGIAIKDESLWALVAELHDAEVARFGRRYSEGASELKGRRILDRRSFTHAQLNCEVLPHEAPFLAKEILDDGKDNNSVRHLKALGLAKIGYVADVFSICTSYNCKIFASVVEIDAPPTSLNGLRKDYAYLFERFFYFLEDESSNSGYTQQGVLVFDELEKSKSHILIDQAHRYFKETATGRHRASLIIPEPFFVHSDLTTGVQIADLIAYCISWGFRVPGHFNKPARPELAPYATQLAKLRHHTYRERYGNPNFEIYFEIWSIAHIADLRTSLERVDE
jgi:hypothetical protein